MEIIKDAIYTSEKKGTELVFARFIKEGDKAAMHYRAGDEVVMSSFDNYTLTHTGREEYYGVSILNGRTQIDGPSEPTDLDKTEESKKVVLDFIENIVKPGAFNKLDQMEEYISKKEFHHHNANSLVSDGLSQFKFSVERRFEQGQELRYDEVQEVIAQGDMVFTKCVNNWVDPDTNEAIKIYHFDIFRVKDGLIVENWEVTTKE